MLKTAMNSECFDWLETASRSRLVITAMDSELVNCDKYRLKLLWSRHSVVILLGEKYCIEDLDCGHGRKP